MSLPRVPSTRVTIGGDDDLERLRRYGRAVAEAPDAMLSAVAPGVATSERDAGGSPAAQFEHAVVVTHGQALVLMASP